MTVRFKPSSTVALIIEHDNKLLLVEELDEFGKKVIGFPAGHVDANENILDAAIREAKEETSLDVELIDIVGIYDYARESATTLRFLFRAKAKEIPTKLEPSDPDGDIIEIKWLSIDEIKACKDSWRTRLVGYNLNDYIEGISFPLSLIKRVAP